MKNFNISKLNELTDTELIEAIDDLAEFDKMSRDEWIQFNELVTESGRRSYLKSKITNDI